MPTSRCLLPKCEWVSHNTWRHIAGCYATWHVYENHREEWEGLFGDRPPVDPDPRTSDGMKMAIIEATLAGQREEIQPV